MCATWLEHPLLARTHRHRSIKDYIKQGLGDGKPKGVGARSQTTKGDETLPSPLGTSLFVLADLLFWNKMLPADLNDQQERFNIARYLS